MNEKTLSPVDKQRAKATTQAFIGHLKVGIVETDIHVGQLVRKALTNIGVTQTVLARSSTEALAKLQERAIDVLIVDWDIRPKSGIELTEFLRTPSSPDPFIPIILTTSRQDTVELKRAQDAGINELIPKPFNVRSMLETLGTMLEHPRAFIVSSGYIGPNRRRGLPATNIPEERRSIQPKKITKNQFADAFVSGTPSMIPPGYDMQERIAANFKQMAGIENLLSEEEASRHTTDYVQWMLQDMETLTKSHKNITTNPTNTRHHIERIASTALSVRTRALQVGYSYAAHIAIGLHDFCRKDYQPRNEDHYRVLDKYVRALQAVLDARIIGDDHPVGKELVEELRRLTLKYK